MAIVCPHPTEKLSSNTYIWKQFIESRSSPAEKVDEGEALQIYTLQPKHPPQIHTVWRQTTTQVPYTIEQTPEQKKFKAK